MQGTRLGPYQFLERLGAGGMGEVWAAQDTRLGRKVAIKVLPAEYATDRDRLARFEQEARAAAALNHPHIAAVYDVGHEAGTHFLVQELLEGQSLRDVLRGGALPRARALHLAAEIAEALAAAHRSGIVHRDLKPENVFVSPDGHAKVLDFGLAKLTEAAAPSLSSSSMSPTVLGTVSGTIMGTAGYMAPEQVMGQQVDGRTDLFALGCVLYEMLTGERAFRGETVIDTLHAITRTQPRHVRKPAGALDADSQWLLEKCLEKEAASRYQHADDLAVDLRRMLTRPAELQRAAPVLATPTRSGRLSWAVAFVATAIAAFAAWSALAPAPVAPVVRLSIPMMAPAIASHYHAISPDGSRVAYTEGESGALRMRRIDSFDAVPVPGGEGAIGPFFSPDGRQLGFFARGKLLAIDVAGGAAREICDVSTTNSAAVWASDGSIYFVQWATGRGLYRVPAAGGAAVEVVPPDEHFGRAHGPRLLADGSGVVVQVAEALGRGTRSVVYFFDGRAAIVVDNAQASFLADGTALYVSGGSLYAARYDAATYAISGSPVALADGVVDYMVSDSGALAYRWGNPDRMDRFARVSRDGGVIPIAEVAPRSATRAQVSPDGSQFLTNDIDGNGLYLWDARRGTRLLVREDGLYPVWLPDGDGYIYLDRAAAGRAIRRSLLSDPSVDEVLVLPDSGTSWPTAVSPDGRLLAYYRIDPQTERDLWMLPLDGGEPFPFLVTSASERSAVFSPDGRWVAYLSDITGSEEVYVRPAPGRSGSEVIVTPAGGREPRWSPRGDEIYFRKDDGLWAVPLQTEPRFALGDAELLFSGNFSREEGGRNQEYDVFPDGDFLMAYTSDELDELRVVVNWSAELERLGR